MALRLERRCPMCFEFEQAYYRQRAEEARKALELAERQHKQPKPSVPAKPAEADTAREQGQPVPV
jgi:hypothetical protein